MIRLETNYPVAIESPDHIAPVGTVDDNTTDIDYINAVKNYFDNKQIRVLDLGCAGGQLISDFISRGDVGVGLEGSTNARERGAGKHNWDQHGDKNLFTVDLSKPYQLYEDDKKMQFDFITTWEVVEHIAEEDLKTFFEQINNHLKDDGVFCGLMVSSFVDINQFLTPLNGSIFYLIVVLNWHMIQVGHLLQ